MVTSIATGDPLPTPVAEPDAYELSVFGVRVKIVEPGYGPTTRFAANAPAEMGSLLPEPYAAYAGQLMRGLAGGKTTNEMDVARAICSRARAWRPRARHHRT